MACSYFFQLFIAIVGGFVGFYLVFASASINFAPKASKAMREKVQAPRATVATISAHTIFIVMLFVLPELVMAIAMPHRSHWGFYPGFYVKAVVFLGVFYLNYFLLVDRELGRERPRIWKFVGLNALVIVLAIGLNQVIGVLFYDNPRPRRWEHLSDLQKFAGILSFALRDAVMMILAIGLAAAMRLSTRWTDIQLQRQKLLSAQRESELTSLKSQLNPHFLFNTLNSIYALIDINSEDAKRAVHKLSGMLRYMLYENEPAVPLQRETEFLANYVALMQLRLRVTDHPLQVEMPGEEATEGIAVPPLIFIPLVENALKYGVEAAPGVPVKISMKIADRAITFATVNGYAHTQSKKERGGIGLTNLRRRLVLIYGSKASLRTSIEGRLFRADLTLPVTIPALPAKNTDPDER